MTISNQISLSDKMARYAQMAVQYRLSYLRKYRADLADDDDLARSDMDTDITCYEALLRQLRGE